MRSKKSVPTASSFVLSVSPTSAFWESEFSLAPVGESWENSHDVDRRNSKKAIRGFAMIEKGLIIVQSGRQAPVWCRKASGKVGTIFIDRIPDRECPIHSSMTANLLGGFLHQSREILKVLQECQQILEVPAGRRLTIWMAMLREDSLQ